MAQGTNLTKALEWFDRAVKKEAEGNTDMMNKCLTQALKFEKEGLAAGESYD